LSAQFKGKMNFNSAGKTRSFTVYSANEGYRYEFNEDGQQGVVIVKSNSQQVIILMPQQKMAMKSSPDNPMSMMNDPLKAFEHYKTGGILKETGKETINGIPCIRSELFNKENPSQKMFTMWYSDKYKFPMKMVNHIDGSQNSGMEMSDVEPWTPDPQSFEIPAGYQVMNVPGMPQK
jgi:outer membrane lipoprotein-sorting protein